MQSTSGTNHTFGTRFGGRLATRSRPPGSREYGYSLLHQASQAQTGDEEFEYFRCVKVSVLAKASDGQLGVEGKHSTEFGARLVEMAEMRIGGDFYPHHRDHARLLVQGAVDPLDRLFEAPRGEMSGSDNTGVEKGQRIERAQPARPFDRFDRR